MSSLRIKEPLRIKGLPDEAAGEWEGLVIGLASTFPHGIGTIGVESGRIWDDELKIYRCDGPFPHDSEAFLGELCEKYMWVSRDALINACRRAQSSKPHIMQWLTTGRGSRFHYFCVDLEVAEYLP